MTELASDPERFSGVVGYAEAHGITRDELDPNYRSAEEYRQRFLLSAIRGIFNVTQTDH